MSAERDTTDPDAGAERQVEDLKHQGDKLDQDIEQTRGDWESKQEDTGVPGAVPDPDDEGHEEDADAEDDGE
jgi:hypothetical protein